MREKYVAAHETEPNYHGLLEEYSSDKEQEPWESDFTGEQMACDDPTTPEKYVGSRRSPEEAEGSGLESEGEMGLASSPRTR